MKIKKAALHKTVFNPDGIILDPLGKIVFMGRSNVGKSSLINSLCGQKRLARTSSRPGKTVSINYYLINEGFYFVDLPGYGYARIPKSETRRIKHLISQFFDRMERLTLVVMLIDSRRGFMEADLDLMEKIIEKKFKILTILTKSDKISSSHLKNQTLNYRKEFDLVAIPFSIKSPNHKEKILEYIDQALIAEKQDG